MHKANKHTVQDWLTIGAITISRPKEKTMKDDSQTYEPHHPARPLKVVLDDDGCTWICDAFTDENGDLAGQGCWRCSDAQFTRND